MILRCDKIYISLKLGLRVLPLLVPAALHAVECGFTAVAGCRVGWTVDSATSTAAAAAALGGPSECWYYVISALQSR